MKKILTISMLLVVILANIKNIQLSKDNEITKDILSHYNKYVITNKKANLYILNNNKYQEIGTINQNEILELVQTGISQKDKYFHLKEFNNEYYIKYKDVNPIDKKIKYTNRYKSYILFNQNIVTKNITHFYDEYDNLIYTINKNFDLPIIIKDNNKYGIEINNRLLYVKKDDIITIKSSHNTDKTNTDHIGVLNYHFFWDDAKESKKVCNQIICHSKSQFKNHLDIIKEMNLLTLTMSEVEKYIDNKIQLPRSVLITIDDGWRAKIGIDILNEYKMNATLFLITSYYKKEQFLENRPYLEIHSHTDNLHEPGKCNGGQGSGLRCLSKDVILNDLKTSRQKLDNTTILCYPYYEYNNYTIELVKEAGFTMAFTGENKDNYIKVGIDKYTIPRFVITTYTTIKEFKNYLNQ